MVLTRLSFEQKRAFAFAFCGLHSLNSDRIESNSIGNSTYREKEVMANRFIVEIVETKIYGLWTNGVRMDDDNCNWIANLFGCNGERILKLTVNYRRRWDISHSKLFCSRYTTYDTHTHKKTHSNPHKPMHRHTDTYRFSIYALWNCFRILIS